MRAGFWWGGAAGDPRGTFMVPQHVHAGKRVGTERAVVFLGGLFPLVE